LGVDVSGVLVTNNVDAPWGWFRSPLAFSVRLVTGEGERKVCGAAPQVCACVVCCVCGECRGGEMVGCRAGPLMVGRSSRKSYEYTGRSSLEVAARCVRNPTSSF
jgi:hypothetical protein